MSRKATLLQKPLDEFHKLITVAQPKRKQINLKQNTVDRITSTLLMQMVTGKSPQYSCETLALIGEMLYTFACDILAKDNPKSALEQFITAHKRDHGEKIFKTSPTTLNQAIGNVTIKTADHIMDEASAKIEDNLRKQGLWSKDTVLALDPNHTRYYGKYVNRFHNWGHVGQKPTYFRTFKEVSFYASTPQLIMRGAVEPILPSDKRLRKLPIWVTTLQNQCIRFHDSGTRVKCIYGDREYYSSLAMAYSYLKLWVPSKNDEKGPRFVVPKKMWGDREKNKWTYLTTRDSPEIMPDRIELDYYFNKFLGNKVNSLDKKGNGTRHMVPTWSVAVFDTYGNGKELKPLSWGKKEALRIQAKLQSASKDLKDAESAFSTFIKKHNLTNAKVPSYKGKKRSIFNSIDEKLLYFGCWKAKASLKFWQKKKFDLTKRLIFFSVSANQEDDLKECTDELIALAGGYHERWGVESCFKDLQYKFHIKTNSRKVTARHVRFVLGALVYNAWHYYRLLRISRILKKRKKSWKPYVPGHVPNRKKYERKYGSILDAGCFTHQILRRSLISTLKRELKTI